MKIKKISITLLILLILLPLGYSFSYDDTSIKEPTISASSAYLMDNRTNKVLYQKDGNKKMYPASTTKILTAIITLENCNLDDIVTANYDAIISIPDGYSTANIQVGEQLTVEQLLELLLVHSANDAANVLAIHVGGSINSFVSMMNTKLSDLNLTDSHFTNCYGKHEETHYTTAHDLAYIMKYCLTNDTFRKICGKASCSIPATNKSDIRTYTSTNELIIPNIKSYYPYLTCGKTGYTSQAKGCLVSSSYKDDLELIGVILGSDNRFADTKIIYEYAYSNYSIKSIANKNDIVSNIEIKNATKDTKNLNLLLSEEILALTNNNESISEIKPEIILNDNISAPIYEGTVLGKASYTINGVTYTTNIVASNNVYKSKLPKYICYIIFSLILISLICIILLHKNRNNNKRYN